MLRVTLCIVLLIAVATALTACANGGADEKKDQAAPAAAMSPAISPTARAGDMVYAYVDAARADLSDGKVRVINQVMRLTPEESKVFWPIYHDYEDELFALGDHRVELTKSFVNAQVAGALDNDRAAKLTDDWFKFETQRLQLLEKYHKQIAAELSPVRAAQFTQIEHRMATMVDLVIASELPLVRGPGPKAMGQ